jgi:class 3 adenylate cyclase
MNRMIERSGTSEPLDESDRIDRPVGTPVVGALVAVDVVASTRRLAVLGDAEACREHQRLCGLLSAMTTTHYGALDGERGEGVIARFDSVANATAAAMCMTAAAPEVSSTLGGEPLRVRAGIHWGSMLVDDDGHTFGLAVAIALRVCMAGEPGRVTLSDPAATLLAQEGWTCLDRVGPAVLKGVPEPQELWQVAQSAPPCGFHGDAGCAS